MGTFAPRSENTEERKVPEPHVIRVRDIRFGLGIGLALGLGMDLVLSFQVFQSVLSGTIPLCNITLMHK